MFLTSVWEKIKELIRSMLGTNNISSALHITPTISQQMIDAIELWDSMYKNESPWLKEGAPGHPVTVKSLGLPSFIASEKARTALTECAIEVTPLREEIEIDNPNYVPAHIDADTGLMVGGDMPMKTKELHDVGDTTRANYIREQFEKVKTSLRRQLEYGIAKGGFVIKPYVVFKDTKPEGSDADEHNGRQESTDIVPQIEFDYVQADGFYPISFDGSGKITEAAFIQRKIDKNDVYTRLEYHKLENNRVTIQNRLYKSHVKGSVLDSALSDNDLGVEVPLSTIPEWSGLEREVIIDNVDRLLFAYFRMPEANTIDPYSPLGVSGYSRAVSLIEEADKQYSRMLWEFEGGELAIDVDRDALSERSMQNADGTTSYQTDRPVLQERLFRKIDLNSEETYNVFNPAFRDVSLMNGLNNILMRIEDVTGLSRGTITDATQEARTATELRILKQRSYATNHDIQMSLEDTLRDVLYIMDTYCTLYGIVPDGDFDVAFTWDDSILVDMETELGKRITLIQNGLSSKLETRMWYFNETESQAKIALDKIREESMETVQQNINAQQNLAAQKGAIAAKAQEKQEDTDGNSIDGKPTKSNADKMNGKDPDGKAYKKISGPS